MSTRITDIVKEKYAAVAASDLSNDHAGVQAVAEAFGYSAAELASIPAGANMGLSCGNPTATASIKEGEVVVDLGSGGGLDVFLAAQKVGPRGKAIGIDMTPAMIDRARRNAAEAGLTNVAFLQADIDKLPLADGSVDCVISNCVINLAPDKAAVFREIYRVLKPGGRLAVSDIALKQALPAELTQDVLAYVGCIAGAIAIADYVGGLKAAGFAAVHVADSGADLNAYSRVEGSAGCCSSAMEVPLPQAESCCGPSCCGGGSSNKAVKAREAGGVASKEVVHKGLAAILSKYDVNAYAASVKVYAVKPG